MKFQFVSKGIYFYLLTCLCLLLPLSAQAHQSLTQAYLLELRGGSGDSHDILKIAKSYAFECKAIYRLASSKLSVFSLKHLQIRSALKDTLHWSEVLVKTVSDGASPEVVRRRIRNVRMWADTVTYHLDEAKAKASVKTIQAKWAELEALSEQLNTY